MNFTKKKTIEKQQELYGSSRRITTKLRIHLFRLSLVMAVFLVMAGIYSAFGAFQGILNSTPSADSVDIAPKNFSTTIYDVKGKQVQKLVGSDANRSFVSIDKIPSYVQNAFIAIEDERFYTHNGIDIKGIFRAAFTGLSSMDFNQGASTITQQLLKNSVFSGGNESTFAKKVERKIQEQYLALQLEETMNKTEILENYLNTINLGQNCLGIQSAAKRYFDKDTWDLTLSEAAVIAGITKNPSDLNPITNPERNELRRNEILNKMLEQKHISQKEYEKALKDKVYSRIKKVNKSYTKSSTVNSYFVDELISQLEEDLKNKLGYSSSEAYNLIYRGGLSIYTTQDTNMQKICDEAVSDASLFPTGSKYELIYRLTVTDKEGKQTNYSEYDLLRYFQKSNKGFSLYFSSKADAKPYIQKFRKSILKKTGYQYDEYTALTIQPQVSFVLMNQSTGQVKALVGGRGTKTANRTLNRATNTVRQPGSTFKILSTFLPALDSADMSLATVYEDAEYYYPGTKIKVNNSTRGLYKGLTTLREAIIRSVNTVTVKTLYDVTPKVGMEYLLRLGFTTLDETNDTRLPLALGGLTNGVTNIELTSAFAAIANKGVYTKPIYYTKVVDHDGNIILENKEENTRVMKHSTAWLLTNAMEDVVTKGTGTLTRFNSVKMPIAGKTGTSSKSNDSWFVGYTPYYTAGIWGGYDSNGEQNDTTYTKKVWKAIMEKIHQKLEYKEFQQPSSIVSADICSKSGKLAKKGICNNSGDGSTIRKEYFAGSIPTETCDIHQRKIINKEKDEDKKDKDNEKENNDDTETSREDTLTNTDNKRDAMNENPLSDNKEEAEKKKNQTEDTSNTSKKENNNSKQEISKKETD